MAAGPVPGAETGDSGIEGLNEKGGNTNGYQEIPEGVTVSEGMIYSNGEFKESPLSPDKAISRLKERVSATEDAVLALMML